MSNKDLLQMVRAEKEVSSFDVSPNTVRQLDDLVKAGKLEVSRIGSYSGAKYYRMARNG